MRRGWHWTLDPLKNEWAKQQRYLMISQIKIFRIEGLTDDLEAYLYHWGLDSSISPCAEGPGSSISIYHTLCFPHLRHHRATVAPDAAASQSCAQRQGVSRLLSVSLPVCQRRICFPEALADSPSYLFDQNEATWPGIATELYPAGVALVLEAGFASMEERGGIGGRVGNQKGFPQTTHVLGIQEILNLFCNFHISTLWNKIMFMKSRFSWLSHLDSSLLSLLDDGELFFHLIHSFIYLPN